MALLCHEHVVLCPFKQAHIGPEEAHILGGQVVPKHAEDDFGDVVVLALLVDTFHAQHDGGAQRLDKVGVERRPLFGAPQCLLRCLGQEGEVVYQEGIVEGERVPKVI